MENIQNEKTLRWRKCQDANDKQSHQNHIVGILQKIKPPRNSNFEHEFENTMELVWSGDGSECTEGGAEGEDGIFQNIALQVGDGDFWILEHCRFED